MTPDNLGRFFDLLKETFFPHFCGMCHKMGSPLCDSCFFLLGNALRQSQSCGHCGICETPSGSPCFGCSGQTPHDGIFAALHYDNPHVSHLIHLFKYRFIRDLASPLGALLAEAILRSDLAIPDVIIPVPLHPRRERWRGWNQSGLLAEAIINHLPEGLAPPIFDNILIRTRYTTPQMSIRDRLLRKKNIEKAFDITLTEKATETSCKIEGKSIWLIDDVAASGATIAACAETLKKIGARTVFGIVVAR